MPPFATTADTQSRGAAAAARFRRLRDQDWSPSASGKVYHVGVIVTAPERRFSRRPLVHIARGPEEKLVGGQNYLYLRSPLWVPGPVRTTWSSMPFHLEFLFPWYEYAKRNKAEDARIRILGPIAPNPGAVLVGRPKRQWARCPLCYRRRIQESLQDQL